MLWWINNNVSSCRNVMSWTTSGKRVAAAVSLATTVLPFMILTCADRLSGFQSVCFCVQTVRNAAEPWTLCLWLTAQSQWVWLTSPWRRTLSSTPSTDWVPLPKTPSQIQVDMYLLMHMFSCFFNYLTASLCNETTLQDDCQLVNTISWVPRHKSGSCSVQSQWNLPGHPAQRPQDWFNVCFQGLTHRQTQTHVHCNFQVYF